MTGPLSGLKVLDLSRILAGPTCTQLLADMGADVIKVENPLTDGDDTRSWGPPFVTGVDGKASDLSAYFVCANRNKRSIAIDLASAEGQKTVRKLAARSNVLVENFKTGALKKYGLDYGSLSNASPGLVYCSISGFGQTGPNASKPGYDLMAQAYGGIMSLTGAPDGEPMKVAVGIADVMCGMYASTGILAALRHRDQTGEGQHIDLALVDTQIAWLINEGVNYLTSGDVPQRRGNGHPNIVPYQVFPTRDGHVVIAVGNDGQFSRFAEWIGHPEWAKDPRFVTNPARLSNRDALVDLITEALASYEMDAVIAGLEAVGVPVGPVNSLDRVFGSDQVTARNMQICVPCAEAASGKVDMIGNPLRFSKTPVSYHRPPPKFGEHTDEILGELE
ncbi:CaiB/BaiF CoA-transferase family protein [uncultured Roseovarius sp.]|uniref:CaiB/BaiF CoA transferase family protein n=1 Tax=uncultured Roseovarius sp. TaxID=293344 RepID=UPI00260B6E84|nr:CaiB/BaiF CoA-transferase family protein [uncultured Roseovarius sp.]